MRFVSALLCALVGLSLAPPTSAQSPREDDKRAARELADKGYEAMEARSYADAIAYFEKAEARVHAPTFVVFMAEAHDKLGKLVAARALYDRAATETLAPDAPPAFREAQSRAREKLAELEPRIPKLRITTSGAAGAARVITIDGAAVSPDDARQGVRVDPGTHAIVASEGGRRVSRTVSVAPGRTETVELVFSGASVLPAAPAAPRGQPGSLVPAGVAFGVGVAAAAVGLGTGMIALGKKNDLEAQCVEKHCRADAEPIADSATTFGTISTVAFVVAIVGVGGGVTLLVIRPSGRAAGPAGSARIGLGPGGVTARGTF